MLTRTAWPPPGFSDSGLADDLVGLGHRFDRILRLFDRRLRDGDRDRIGLAVTKLGVDTGSAQDHLDLLRLRDVARNRDSNHLAHCGADDTTSGSRRCEAPPFKSCGVPRSTYGTSTTSKSRGTTVSGKTSRASRAISPP